MAFQIKCVCFTTDRDLTLGINKRLSKHIAYMIRLLSTKLHIFVVVLSRSSLVNFACVGVVPPIQAKWIKLEHGFELGRV